MSGIMLRRREMHTIRFVTVGGVRKKPENFEHGVSRGTDCK